MKFFWPKESDNWKETIEYVSSQQPLTPFHPEVLSFLHSLSKAILKDHSFREYPELVALAYWLRKAHLADMQNNFLEKVESRVVLARGTALHFAPSNVDTIFVYSWVLSMLAGNSNILRISSRKQEQTERLLDAIMIALGNSPEVAARTVIMTYNHHDETTKYLSERCHVRVIWGGDETVKSIRAIPLAPIAVELAFPDRFSLSVIEANTLLNTTDVEFANLIYQFYNDGFWFAQMACSSPRLIVWVGKNENIKTAQQRFWSSLDEFILGQQKDERSPALQVQKLVTGYFLSAKEPIESFSQQPNFSRVKIKDMNMEMREKHCGGGLFFELETAKLNDLILFLKDKDQTLSYFGFSREQLIDFTKSLSNRSIDRIVPIGQSLNFEGIWDGNDLLMHFTREIVIR